MPRPAGPPRGLLLPAAPVVDGEREHRRVLPSDALAPWIAHFWWVRWDLSAPFVAETLPHPTVHLVFEPPRRAAVTFVPIGRFRRTLRGRGHVVGIKFRPATFQPLVGGSLSARSGTVVPIARALGAPGAELGRALLAAPSFEDAIAIAERALPAMLAPLPPSIVALRDLVERMERDRTLLRVEDAARSIDLDVRALQRQFARFVGVGPKQVIQRYRLHEAAARLAGPRPPALGALAAELGYFDQPHFVRDFRAVIGVAPGKYLRERGR